MSLVEAGVECEPAAGVEFEPGIVPPVGAEGGWGTPEVCPEGAEAAVGCAVEPEGAGVDPTVEDMAENQKVDEGREMRYSANRG